MKFIARAGKNICNCCNKPYKADKMQYIGYQIIDEAGNGFPLFNCLCGTTVSGVDYLFEEKAKVSVKESDEFSITKENKE